jgi:hypothetical protein
LFHSSQAILEWFLPLYLDYCNVFNFDCSVERGCGFDDKCSFDENCVVDVLAGPGRYKCQGELLALNLIAVQLNIKTL